MIGAIQAHIESMAFKGYGVARTGGKVLFVPYSVTGDHAWIKVIETKKNYSVGRLSQLIEPSPLRTVPPCPYFGICGGCQWQHIDYLTHGRLKKEVLEEILKRLGGLKPCPSIDVTASPQPYGYRVRVQLKVRRKAMGYYEERSHRIVDIDRCPISHPLVNRILLSLRKNPSFMMDMEGIEINVSPEEGKGILILHPLSSHQRTRDLEKQFLQIDSILKGIAVVTEKGWIYFGEPFLNFTISFTQGEERRVLRLRSSPESFFQVSLEQNQTLIQSVLEFSKVNEDERVLDLYAGAGNFSLPLAMASREVWGIEENPTAVRDGRFNAEKNGIKNCRFVEGKVEDILKDWRREKPDLIILDPPRVGCKAALDHVVRLRPNKIVYTSCDPTTFARDLRLFSERGFHLQTLRLVDMFPQTFHMEVVGLLTQSQV
jgi:23S rRNA (uracil1939-C5)-methyltransferase